jgi:hypothetical protein
MNPSPTISYELAQSRITDLRHQARRESLARTARSQGTQDEPQPHAPRIPRHLHLRHRVTTAAG